MMKLTCGIIVIMFMIMGTLDLQASEYLTYEEIHLEGSIGIDVSGKISSFDAGLDSSLSLKASHEFSSTMEETVEINISVDPDTRLFVEIYGEGLISNGVGERYRFFRNVGSGGFEVFTLQSEHYSIVKERMES